MVTGSCVIRETTQTGCPWSRPRVSLSLGCGCGRRLVTGSRVILETTQTGCPWSTPRVSLPSYFDLPSLHARLTGGAARAHEHARRGLFVFSSSMAEVATEHRRTVSLPWFLPFICFIPLLIAAPLWHQAPADAVASTFVQPSKPVVEKLAPRPVRAGVRKGSHLSAHNVTRHTREVVSG